MSAPLTNKQKLSPITPNANASNFGPNSLVTQWKLPQATTQKFEDLNVSYWRRSFRRIKSPTTGRPLPRRGSTHLLNAG